MQLPLLIIFDVSNDDRFAEHPDRILGTQLRLVRKKNFVLRIPNRRTGNQQFITHFQVQHFSDSIRGRLVSSRGSAIFSQCSDMVTARTALRNRCEIDPSVTNRINSRGEAICFQFIDVVTIDRFTTQSARDVLIAGDRVKLCHISPGKSPSRGVCIKNELPRIFLGHLRPTRLGVDHKLSMPQLHVRYNEQYEEGTLQVTRKRIKLHNKKRRLWFEELDRASGCRQQINAGGEARNINRQHPLFGHHTPKQLPAIHREDTHRRTCPELR